MGWVWSNDESDEFDSSAGEVKSGEQCAIRKVVKSRCRVEEVEPGKFIRKCEKVEQVMRDCIGKPVEVVVSNKEYTEDDVTDELLKRPLSFETSENGALDFPGLHNDIEAISRSFFNSLNRFFEEAEEMKNGFFNAFGFPRVFDGGSSSSRSTRRGVPIEGHRQDNSSPKPTEHDPGHVDLAGLAKDV